MNIGIFAGMARTTDDPHVSRNTSPHEGFCPDRNSNTRGEGLSGWNSMAFVHACVNILFAYNLCVEACTLK